MTAENKDAQQAPQELSPGFCGQFLSEHGIKSTRQADSCGVETIVIDANDLIQTMRILRNSPEVELNFLLTITGVDSQDTFDSVYHLRSFYNDRQLVVKVCIPKSSVKEGELPCVPSLANIWKTANWHERETYDLVGIRYTGHPYMRRILNPWDWEGHPLRKDYVQIEDALNDKNPKSFR